MLPAAVIDELHSQFWSFDDLESGFPTYLCDGQVVIAYGGLNDGEIGKFDTCRLEGDTRRNLRLSQRNRFAAMGLGRIGFGIPQTSSQSSFFATIGLLKIHARLTEDRVITMFMPPNTPPCLAI